MAAHCFDPNNKARYVSIKIIQIYITLAFIIFAKNVYLFFSVGTLDKCRVLKLLIY